MLNQFFADWNTAIQSRMVVNETRNKEGVITMQETKFKFRDIDIIMYSRIVPSTANNAPDQRRWYSEMYVPSTNKIIPSVRYNSKSECAIRILMALVPGRDHEDRVEARNYNRKKRYLERLSNERMKKLADTSFTEEQKAFIVKWLGDNVVPHHAAWNDTVIDTLCKYHSYITGIGLAEQGIVLNREADLHVGRMYNTACQMITESIKNRDGIPVLRKTTISYSFLAPRTTTSYGIYVVRSGYSKIYDECHRSTVFMHFLRLAVELFALITGVAVDDRIAEIKLLREKNREKKQQREMNGEKPFTRRTNSRRNVSAFSNTMSPIGSTLGDVFGDVLDQAKPEQDNIEKDANDYPKRKRKKAPVTDGQINGKILETEKEGTVEEQQPEDNEMLPPVPEEIEIDMPEKEEQLPPEEEHPAQE
jgi:hypothetical protein